MDKGSSFFNIVAIKIGAVMLSLVSLRFHWIKTSSQNSPTISYTVHITIHHTGSKFLYTTYGWTLISAVVESAGGKPFLKQMADIFRDLDMMHTVPDEHIPLIYNRARSV